jgi:hypothetical protein
VTNAPVATTTTPPATTPPPATVPPPETRPAQPDVTQAADTQAAAQPDTAPPPVDHTAMIMDHLDKANAAIAAQKWDDAQKELDPVLALDKEHPAAKALAAKVASEKAVEGAFSEAQAAQAKNDLPAAWAALQKLQAMPADSVYAARVSEMKNAVGPAIANGLVDQAKQLVAKKKWDEAVAKCEDALKIMSNHPEAPEVIVKARKLKLEEAKREAAKDPNKPPDPDQGKKPPPDAGKPADQLYKDARALHNTDPGAALKLYEQAAAKGYAAAHKMIASIKIQKGDNAGAIASYKKYLQLVPSAKDADTVRDLVIKLGGTPP